jgi:hypothetical protein
MTVGTMKCSEPSQHRLGSGRIRHELREKTLPEDHPNA